MPGSVDSFIERGYSQFLDLVAECNKLIPGGRNFQIVLLKEGLVIENAFVVNAPGAESVKRTVMAVRLYCPVLHVFHPWLIGKIHCHIGNTIGYHLAACGIHKHIHRVASA